MFFLAALHKKTDKDLWSLAASSSTAAGNHARAAYCFKHMAKPGQLDKNLLLKQAEAHALAKEHRKAPRQQPKSTAEIQDNSERTPQRSRTYLSIRGTPVHYSKACDIRLLPVGGCPEGL